MIKRFSSTITLYGNSTKTLNGASRPLLLFLPWYGAKCHAMDHYRQIYYPYGFDILSVESSILHFLWPQYGLSYASEVLDLLQSEPFSSRPLLIHAFSIGGFLFAEMLIITQRDVPRYSGFGSRIMGQIFDSLVAGDVELLANDIPQVLAPPILQPFFKKITLFYFWLLSGYTVKHYQAGIRAFWEIQYHTPILLFYSENDPLSNYKKLEAMLFHWQKKGIPAIGKSWKMSCHAGHLRQHPQEYRSTLQNFLQSIGIIHLPSKL
ncbi:transmembrane protein 53-A [Chiloscyllium plagiosum]|uniref:transmembrane protein 53-A n=1 Tax=Chiloscyllium plagiosum TaxID=36176 RepID=UPI001CB7F805|nr:transmembrane protein 53-A [Chiloscyllium plagiosum]